MKYNIVKGLLVVSMLLVTVSCRSASKSGSAPLIISSPSFETGETIPPRQTCIGEDVSPPLNWTGGLDKVVSYAIICEDPDAPGGTWIHWVIFDIPMQTTSLPEGVSDTPQLEDGSKQGINDFKKLGYGGPCPPPGKPHRYYFRLYGLDQLTGLEPGSTADELKDRMRGHIVAQGELMGVFGR